MKGEKKLRVVVVNKLWMPTRKGGRESGGSWREAHATMRSLSL